MRSTLRKYASPDALFTRFLQRKNKKPTERQIHTWENDGGHLETNQQDFVVMNGVIYNTLMQRVRAYVYKYWRFVRYQMHHQ